MSPTPTATREQMGSASRPVPPSRPADVLFAADTAAKAEIVVDWQLPSDMERDRR